LVYFTAIWYILWSFGTFCGLFSTFCGLFGTFCGFIGTFCGLFGIFFRFGIFYQDKSGNPGLDWHLDEVGACFGVPQLQDEL
jgi:hypothetical protein